MLDWDAAAVEAVQALRVGPLTWLFVLLSAWWVKSVLIVAAGAAADTWARRRVPVAAISAAVAFTAAWLLSDALKQVFARPRPPVADPELEPLVALPGSFSFPSGHAATAFAAAAAVGFVAPRLRWPLLALAALVALSRVYLGVHYPLDVLAGAALGLALGWLATRAARQASRELARSGA